VIKVAVTMPSTIGDTAELLADARALEAAGAEMIGFEEGGVEYSILLGAIAAVTDRLKLRAVDPDVAPILGRLSRGRAVLGVPDGESWVSIPMPPDRASWAATMREHEAAGVMGIIVPWDPRLIDLLRNPDDDDRSDLQMSTG
jgi:hypothetical protein